MDFSLHEISCMLPPFSRNAMRICPSHDEPTPATLSNKSPTTESKPSLSLVTPPAVSLAWQDKTWLERTSETVKGSVGTGLDAVQRRLGRGAAGGGEDDPRYLAHGGGGDVRCFLFMCVRVFVFFCSGDLGALCEAGLLLPRRFVGAAVLWLVLAVLLVLTIVGPRFVTPVLTVKICCCYLFPREIGSSTPCCTERSHTSTFSTRSGPLRC